MFLKILLWKVLQLKRSINLKEAKSVQDLKSNAKKVVKDKEGNKHYILSDKVAYVVKKSDEFIWGDSSLKGKKKAIDEMEKWYGVGFATIPAAVFVAALTLNPASILFQLGASAVAIVLSILGKLGLHKAANWTKKQVDKSKGQKQSYVNTEGLKQLRESLNKNKNV